jgi:hypothetical protein
MNKFYSWFSSLYSFFKFCPPEEICPFIEIAHINDTCTGFNKLSVNIAFVLVLSEPFQSVTAIFG